MSDKTEEREDHKRYVDKIIEMNGGKRFEVWKHFEDNADKLQTTLWDQGKWLLAIQGGVLFLPFTAKLIEPTSYFPFMSIKVPFLVILMYFFGIMLSVYSIVFQNEMGQHIARNFDRAICTREDNLSSLSSPYRISVLRKATWFFIAAFFLMALILLVVLLWPLVCLALEKP